jgi:hypothetical protein
MTRCYDRVSPSIFDHYNLSSGYNHFVRPNPLILHRSPLAVHPSLMTDHCSPVTDYGPLNRGREPLLIILSLLLTFLFACSPSPQPSGKSALYVFRLDLPALVELSSNNQPLREIPVSMPTGCGLADLFPSPRGARLAMELSCSFGQAVVWLDVDTGEFKQPITDSDSHFLAWAPDGEAVYLKANSIDHPKIVRVHLDGSREVLPITELTYDLAPMFDGRDFIFSFSRGMGLGSEMQLAGSDGRVLRQLAADPRFYLSFARWSPDGKQVAYIKIPDSQIPFTVGELWVMSADGSNAHKLSDADAGHGFAPAWSPDGAQLAFVKRENPNDSAADRSADSLVSNIYLVNVQSGTLMPLTRFKDTRLGFPVWSPDGNQIAFTVVMNDKMSVNLVDPVSGETRQVLTGSACCPVWLQK